jgi:HK97 family phage prohead protease
VENIYQIKNGMIGATIDDIDEKKGIVTGYFSHFNNVDADGDVIRPGAFKKSIKENGPKSAQPRIKHLLNHDPSKPLGVLMDLSEDKTGLAYESQIGGHDLGEDFIKMVESGLITEHSIGFRIMKRNQLQPYDNYMKNPGLGYYEITELKLYEGSSLTAWGANPLTPITGLKSLDNIDLIISQTQAIEKFCRNTNATDETIEMLLLHTKQLAQLVIDMQKSSTMPDVTTLPQNDVLDAIREFKQTLKN